MWQCYDNEMTIHCGVASSFVVYWQTNFWW
jgi:hypothetical protein